LRQIGSRGSTQVPEKLATELLQSDPSLSAIIPRLPSANRESMEPIQRLLHDLRAELLCRLEVAEGLHGVILLGRRRDGLVYSAEDFAFLQAMAQMSVLALHSSRANQTMARLNAELKTKMESISEQQRQLAALRSELTILQQEAGQNPVQQSDVELDREGVRGSSPALLSVLTQVRKVARSDSTVLIRGESGTGKELLARVIHRNSERAAASLICVNCAALSSSLLESELFGHVRGAFTGAHADKPGRFLAAHGGTLFLDEIGDISAETQVKLLRVLQERRFEPVGSDRSIDVDVRLVAATNRNLEELIAKGEFREDLFYRLNVVSLTLPALCDRHDDLAELVFYFLSRAARKSRKQIRQIEPAALEALQAHPWPGNIRELENVIERAVVLTDSDVITIADLPDELWNSKTTVQPIRASVRTTSATALTGVARKAPPQAVSQQDEERTIREALRVAGGNKAVAARSLNLPRSTFFSRCRRYGIT
ncbi:MAG: sigma-54 interaction domain-containing protein, partial [Planctomycetaceae bacterium]